MEINTLLILVGIGICAGILSGFVGVGGGMIIVPALIYFLGFSQFQAQGTSLAIMIPPIGILAVMNYYKAGNVNINFALVIAITFIVGGFIGSKLALRLPENKVKLIFGILMLYASVRMIWKAWGNLASDV
jgi:uncharacterized protein